MRPSAQAAAASRSRNSRTWAWSSMAGMCSSMSNLTDESELVSRRHLCRARIARRAPGDVAGRAYSGEVLFVEQVVDVELQREMAVELVRDHRALQPVGIDLVQRAVQVRRRMLADVVAADVGRAVADLQRTGNVVSRPQAQRILRRAQQRIALAVVATLPRDKVRCALQHLRLQVRIVRVYRP